MIDEIDETKDLEKNLKSFGISNCIEIQQEASQLIVKMAFTDTDIPENIYLFLLHTNTSSSLEILFLERELYHAIGTALLDIRCSHVSVISIVS